jgi:hypothetical protein
MPVAVNPAGDAVYLTETGDWQPAQTAINPQTKEKLAFDGKDWQPVQAQSKGALGYVDDAVRSIANGVTFGWADELAAKGNQLLGRGGYEQNLAQERARDAQIPNAIAIPGQIAGAVGGTLAAGPLAAVRGVGALSRLPQTARFAGLGAAEGALAGAGNAEGSRAEGALSGGLIGAGVGAAAPHVVRGVSNMIGGVKNAVSPQANVAADLSRAITRDETTPEALIAKTFQLNQVRPGAATLADAGGENVRGLVERVAQTPGAGRTQVVPSLTERQQGQAMRVATDLRSLTGTTRSAFQAAEETTAERAAAAAPLYRQAYDAGDRAIWSPELERLSSSPTIRGAMQGAVRVWRDNAIASGYGAMNPGALVDRGGQLSFLDGKVPVFPNLQFWDYTKQMVDQRASAAFKAGLNQKGATLAKLAEKLRGELDNMVPEYAPARNAWAGKSQFLDAIEEGRTIHSASMSAEELAARVRSMSDSQREAFRIGAVSSLVSKMGNDPAKLGDMTKYLRSPEMRAKIAAIMPSDEAAVKWAQRLNFEVSSSEMTGRALGNSATARRLAEQKDAENLVGDLIMDAIAGATAPSLLRRVVMAGPRWLRDTLRSRSDRELASVLTDPKRVDDLPDVLGRINAAKRAPGALPNAAATAGGVNLLTAR